MYGTLFFFKILFIIHLTYNRADGIIFLQVINKQKRVEQTVISKYTERKTMKWELATSAGDTWKASFKDDELLVSGNDIDWETISVSKNRIQNEIDAILMYINNKDAILHSISGYILDTEELEWLLVVMTEIRDKNSLLTKILYGAFTNYIINKDGKYESGGMDMRHILADNEEQAKDIYRKMLESEGKIPNTYGYGEDKLAVSRVYYYGEKDL